MTKTQPHRSDTDSERQIQIQRERERETHTQWSDNTPSQPCGSLIHRFMGGRRLFWPKTTHREDQPLPPASSV